MYWEGTRGASIEEDRHVIPSLDRDTLHLPFMSERFNDFSSYSQATFC
jgi:hypothetical protein